MKAIETAPNEFKVVSQLPETWNGVLNYRNAAPSVHVDNGWRDLIYPSLDQMTEKLGDIIRNGDNITFQVVPLSEEEITNRKINQAIQTRETLLNERIKQKEMEQVQAIQDDQEAYEVKDLYPLWTTFPEGHVFEDPCRVTEYEGDELKLFRLIQNHAKESSTTSPLLAPSALWVKVEFGAGGYEIWAQPQGNNGMYPYINTETGEPYRVIHNGRLWENNIVSPTFLNTYVPGEYGWTDLGLYP